MKKILLLIFITGLLCAGGWNKEKNNLFLKLSSRFLSANQLYMSDGNLSPVFGTTKIFQNVIYAEYGISNSLTLIANIPFYNKLIRNNIEFTNSTLIAGAENSGIGDISFGFRYGLAQSGPVVWAVSSQIDFGSGDAKHPSGLYTGDAETNFLFGLEMGHSFNNYKSYLTSSLSLNLRGEDTFSQPISDEFIFGFEIGTWLSNNFLTNLKLRSVTPFGDIENLSEFAQSEYISYELETYYKLSDYYGVTASYTGAFNVKNYFDSAIFSVGIAFDIK